MPELLLEVGCEELPATAVERAFNELRQVISERLAEARLSFGDSVAMGTPRRLIVSFVDVQEQQEDEVKDVRGPSIQAAFDASGEPTKALLGFCRGQGVEPTDARQDGEYVWVTKTIPGRPTRELLAEILPECIRGLSFEKTMRWGSSRMRFARPIRWILAAFGGELVPFELEGIASGLTSRGHRFMAPDEFSATRFDDLVTGLRTRKVEPDPAQRRNRIREQASAKTSAVAELPEALVEENVFLTEWPTAVEGSFRESFLELPECVLVTAMAKHERVFPVRDGEGNLTNRFVAIRNGGDEDTVREGYAWVLNARLNDAKFFYDQDQKYTMDDFLAKTEGIVFHEKLGTVRQRAERLAALCPIALEHLRPDQIHLREEARVSGLYAKADLSTGLVSELPALQGLIGAEYLQREGRSDAVANAVRHQYSSVSLRDFEQANSVLVATLVLADQIDRLTGYVGIGILPKGSSDPYGLRRAATILLSSREYLRNTWDDFVADIECDSVLALVEQSARLYVEQGVAIDTVATKQRLIELLEARIQYQSSCVRSDILEAALAVEWNTDLTHARIQALERLAGNAKLLQTLTRPVNLARSAQSKGMHVPSALSSIREADLESEVALMLYREWDGRSREFHRQLTHLRVNDALDTLADASPLLNRFFDETMVLVDDERVRSARLSLVNAIAHDVLKLGDPSLMGSSGEGTGSETAG